MKEKSKANGQAEWDEIGIRRSLAAVEGYGSLGNYNSSDPHRFMSVNKQNQEYQTRDRPEASGANPLISPLKPKVGTRDLLPKSAKARITSWDDKR